MKAIRFFLVLSFIGFCSLGFSQSHALQLEFDNDYMTDRYYTAGFMIRYKNQIRSDQWLNRFLSRDNGPSLATMIDLNYGFQIFTPNNHDLESLEMKSHDRPFAGWQFLEFQLSRFIREDRINSFQLVFGIVGPGSGMEDLQKTMHSIARYKYPYGWENQIVNEFVFNFGYEWLKEWFPDPEIGIALTSSIEMGTSTNRISQGIHFRLGDINPVRYSAWHNSHTIIPRNPDRTDLKRKESFFISGISVDYVKSNIFIEGSLFDNPSPFTVESKPWVMEGYIGFILGTTKANYGVLAYLRGQEVQNGEPHFFFKAQYGFTF